MFHSTNNSLVQRMKGNETKWNYMDWYIYIYIFLYTYYTSTSRATGRWKFQEKKPISWRKNLPIELAQGHQPVWCPRRVFCVYQPSAVQFWWSLVVSVVCRWWWRDVLWCDALWFVMCLVVRWREDGKMWCYVMWCHVMAYPVISCCMMWWHVVCDVMSWMWCI